jgi:hypothetical protein
MLACTTAAHACCHLTTPPPSPPQVGQEEYYDFIFPEEAGAAPNLKLLEAAYRWKKQKMDTQEEGS